jgi:hypothetical protein
VTGEGSPVCWEIYPASGRDAWRSAPACYSIGMAEHNARKYSRDGRSWVIGHVEPAEDGVTRTRVAEFRGGRKVNLDRQLREANRGVQSGRHSP